MLLVSQNHTQYDKLTSEEQLYARSALQMLIGNLTLIDEISVRTDTNDTALRQVQKKSQIEASMGLAALNSAYASNAGAKADIHIEFALVKYAGSWKLSYTASDIERLTILFVKESVSFPLEQIDTETDRLSFTLLENLSKRDFIPPIPFSIKSQLLHEADSEENFKKYIAEYESRSLDLQKQLDSLQKQAVTAEEHMRNESSERALRLKLEMAERKKRFLKPLKKTENSRQNSYANVRKN